MTSKFDSAASGGDAAGPTPAPGGDPQGADPGAKPARRRVPWKLIGLIVLAVLLVPPLLGGIAAALTYRDLPPLDLITDYRPSQPLRVFTADGTELATFGSERRRYVPIAQIPQGMKNAVLAIEDSRFYEHGGIDAIGVLRAAMSNLTGGRRQGASTITQQVARTFYLSSRVTYERKFKEALLALKIENQLGKEQILELYMNQIYLGHRSYGFGAAAQTYFAKPLEDLTIAEMAMLAGLPQNPSNANPLTNLERATSRQRQVLARMRELGMLDEGEYEQARSQELVIRSAQEDERELHAEYVAEMARRAVVERYGEAAYTGGYRVTTSIHADDQEAAYEAVRDGVIAHDRKGAWRGPEARVKLPDADGEALDDAIEDAFSNQRDDDQLRLALVLKADPKAIQVRLATGETVALDATSLRWARRALADKAPDDLALTRGALIRVSLVPGKGKKDDAWTLAQWPEAQSALISVDPETGRVRALVGGFDFRRQQFNHVTQAWRQPGSSFKPFIYSAALEYGVMPDSLIADEPWVDPLNRNPGWDPQNSDGKFDGPMTMRRALARSKNMVSSRLVDAVGVEQVRAWTSRFGFDPKRQPDNLSIALGAGSTTPMQLASAYSILANGGYRVEPVLIERIVDAAGQTVYEAPPPEKLQESQRVVPQRNVFIMDTLLNEVARSGTAARAQALLKRRDIYGKTGTTNDAVDAWFAGFQPGVVTVVWMGYDDPRSLGSRESGGGLSLPIWVDYMREALKGVTVTSLKPPQGVVQRDGDWLFSEYAQGGEIDSIGVEPVDEEPWWMPGPWAPGMTPAADGGVQTDMLPPGGVAPANAPPGAMPGPPPGGNGARPPSQAVPPLLARPMAPASRPR